MRPFSGPLATHAIAQLEMQVSLAKTLIDAGDSSLNSSFYLNASGQGTNYNDFTPHFSVETFQKAEAVH